MCLGTCAWVPAVSGGLLDRVNLSLVYWRLSEKMYLIKERQNVFNFAFQFILTGINNREQLNRKFSIPITWIWVFALNGSLPHMSMHFRACPLYLVLSIFLKYTVTHTTLYEILLDFEFGAYPHTHTKKQKQRKERGLILMQKKWK